jgi:hypothetical protein
MGQQMEEEISQIEILLGITSKLDEVNRRLGSIDDKFSSFISQRRPKDISPAAKVEEWTDRLKRR